MAKIVFSAQYTPSESVTDGLTLTAILVPEPGKHQLPSWFLTRYFEAIVARAMNDLMTRNEDDSWSNPSRGEYWRKRWLGGIAKAKSDVLNRGRVRSRGFLEDDDDAERGDYV